MTGKVFERLTVLHHGGMNKHNQHQWDCICVCGQETTVLGVLLRNGSTRSCGCLVKEHAKTMNQATHGMHNTRTYHTWEGMKQRCLNPNATRYPEYGAVGVKVCDRWLQFENFLTDMGERPSGRTLDRKNPFGNYEPLNCRWATPYEQQHNQRRHYLSEEVTPPC